MEIFIIYPVFIGISIASAQLAHYRGYSARWWFLISTFLPIISLLILFTLKRRPQSKGGVYAAPVHINNDKVIYKRPESV